jgi:hypothetical protein
MQQSYMIPAGTIFTYIAAFCRDGRHIEIEVMREKVDGPSGSKQIGQRETGVTYPAKTRKDDKAAMDAIYAKNLAIQSELQARFGHD